MKVLSTFFILGLLLFPFNTSAQQDVIEFHIFPPAYAGTPGTAPFLGPLNNADRSYQLLIHQDLLVNLVGKEIQAISWRIPVSAASNWPPVDAFYNNYDIYLGESVPPANRSLTFSENRVGDQTLVRSGNLTIPAGSYTSGNSPNEWGPEITFDNLWLYEGSHLLIEIRHTASGTTNQTTDAISTTTAGYGTLFSACWQSTITPTTGLQGNFSVIRLTADDPVPVELTSFSASVSGNNVVLNWITATEINNYGFEVERKSLTSDYEIIGFVSGAGSTTEIRNYSFSDANLSNGSYSYRLKQSDFDGSFEYSFEVEVEVNMPAFYSLEQNYPNPFNPATNINFSLAEAGFVKLAVYNLLGEEVKLLLNEFKEAGPQTITFDASTITSGIYFYKLETSQFSHIRKMILAK